MLDQPCFRPNHHAVAFVHPSNPVLAPNLGKYARQSSRKPNGIYPIDTEVKVSYHHDTSEPVGDDACNAVLEMRDVPARRERRIAKVMIMRLVVSEVGTQRL